MVEPSIRALDGHQDLCDHQDHICICSFDRS